MEIAEACGELPPPVPKKKIECPKKECVEKKVIECVQKRPCNDTTKSVAVVPNDTPVSKVIPSDTKLVATTTLPTTIPI